MRIAVIADTHVPKRALDLPAAACPIIRSSDAVIHAGDVVCEELLGRLQEEAALHVVRGNNDVTLPKLPETLELELEGVKIAVIHDSGPSKGRAARLRRRFPGADAVIFGHSHIPLLEEHDGFLLLNPGSPTDRRQQPVHTMALLELSHGKIKSAELIPLPPPAAAARRHIR